MCSENHKVQKTKYIENTLKIHFENIQFKVKSVLELVDILEQMVRFHMSLSITLPQETNISRLDENPSLPSGRRIGFSPVCSRSPVNLRY